MQDPTNPTSSATIVPCIWLDDQAEAAARFYTNTFPQGRPSAVPKAKSSTAASGSRDSP